MICIDKSYSTTRLLTREQPMVEGKREDEFETVLVIPEAAADRQGEGGLRTEGYFKKGDTKRPLVTIITVVYNGEQFLEATIRSVINQIYENVEYIIIDGGSTDRTLDIIRKYERSIDYWVSERDKGIYDAMNKGIDLACGDWINFMNAGDLLINVPAFDKISDESTLVYGKAKLGNRKVLSCNKSLKFEDFAYGMVVCHQACFYRKNYYKHARYDQSYKIVADQKFTAQALVDGRSSFVDEVICNYLDDGFSSGQSFTIFLERLHLDKEMGFKVYPAVLSFFRAKVVAIREYVIKTLSI